MRTRNILFLCTHNSARSILAEAILNAKGGDRFRAFSAGSSPKTAPNSLALKLLAEKRYPTEQLRSKSWEAFSEPHAPQMDVIITVCDNAAGETCPIWPGRPATAHWGISDPSAAEGDETIRAQAFERAYSQLEQRIDQLLALPAELDGGAFTEALRSIGASSEGATLRARTSGAEPPLEGRTRRLN